MWISVFCLSVEGLVMASCSEFFHLILGNEVFRVDRIDCCGLGGG